MVVVVVVTRDAFFCKRAVHEGQRTSLPSFAGTFTLLPTAPEVTGRLTNDRCEQVGLGLLRSALASELSGCIEGDEEGREGEEDRFVFGWRGRRTPIRRIVDDHTTIDADHQ